jgi:hypothetical protein
MDEKIKKEEENVEQIQEQREQSVSAKGIKWIVYEKGKRTKKKIEP